jgi:hypothetical protein
VRSPAVGRFVCYDSGGDVSERSAARRHLSSTIAVDDRRHATGAPRPRAASRQTTSKDPNLPSSGSAVVPSICRAARVASIFTCRSGPQISVEPPQCALPGLFGCGLIVAGGRVVVEAVIGAFVDMTLLRHLRLS